MIKNYLVNLLRFSPAFNLGKAGMVKVSTCLLFNLNLGTLVNMDDIKKLCKANVIIFKNILNGKGERCSISETGQEGIHSKLTV